MLGLSRGGQQVGKCKEVFNKAVILLVELASLQVSERGCYRDKYKVVSGTYE